LFRGRARQWKFGKEVNKHTKAWRRGDTVKSVAEKKKKSGNHGEGYLPESEEKNLTMGREWRKEKRRIKGAHKKKKRTQEKRGEKMGAQTPERRKGILFRG